MKSPFKTGDIIYIDIPDKAIMTRAIYEGPNGVVILKDSTIAKISKSDRYCHDVRKQLVESNVVLVDKMGIPTFIHDHKVHSLDIATGIVMGDKSSGLVLWHVEGW